MRQRTAPERFNQWNSHARCAGDSLLLAASALRSRLKDSLRDVRFGYYVSTSLAGADRPIVDW